jgi:chromosome segregation ATPase
MYIFIMSNQVLKITENLTSFVNSNKASFSATQIHAFVDSIQQMQRLYNNQVSEYQGEVNSSLKDLTTNLEFVEKFTRELKGEFLGLNKSMRKMNESLQELNVKVDALCPKVAESTGETQTAEDVSEEVPEEVTEESSEKLATVKESSEESDGDLVSKKVSEVDTTNSAVFETTKVELKEDSTNMKLDVSG